jgi:RHS repeat-associated protein
MQFPSGKKHRYEYDDTERNTSVTDPEQLIPGSNPVAYKPVFTAVYDWGGRMTQMTEGSNQWWQGWSYNGLGQMAGYTWWTSLKNVGVTYDYGSVPAAGKLASARTVVTQSSPTVVLSDETVGYGYDGLGRLTSAAAPGWSQTFTYDGYGNIAQKQGTGAAQYIGTGDYRPYLNSLKNQVGSYDAAGNAAGFTYDYDNRLTVHVDETYAYDPSNRRVLRSKTNGSFKEVTFWAGSQRLGVYRYTPNGSGGWNMQVMGEWGTIGGRAMRPTDRLGSDVSGGRTYLPYGEELNAGPGGAVRFATYWRDEGSELDYADQRYYQRTMGRFLTADPYLASSGAAEPGSWNRYAYVGEDPVNFIDPSGLRRSGLEGTITFSTTAWASTSGLEDDVLMAQLNRRDSELVKAPSFRSRWEEDEFYGRPCREKAPVGPEDASIDANIAEAQTKVREVMDQASQLAKAGGVLDINGVLGLWFAEKVKPGGDWDYKKYGSQYESFGNYNYGAVGTAIGYWPNVLLRAAGAVQQWTDLRRTLTGRPAIGKGFFWGGPPYGDDPKDQSIIQSGVYYAQERANRDCH